MVIKNAEILGTRVNFGFNKSDILDMILNKSNSDVCRQICTVNSEYLVEASKDSEFKSVVNQSYMSIPDSVGVVWALKLLNCMSDVGKNGLLRILCLIKSVTTLDNLGGSLNKVSGADLVPDILNLCEKGSISVYILGGNPGRGHNSSSASIVCNKILKANSKAVISYDESLTPEFIHDTQSISSINKSVEKNKIKIFDVLLVAYGHNKQDKWIYRNLKNIKARYAIGVGGSIDFEAKVQIRAPKILQVIGLEWLWRLLTDPRRFTRILNAVIVFPYLVVKSSLKNK